MGNFYVKPERKGNSPYTRSGLAPPPMVKKSGSDKPNHKIHDPMSLELHMGQERVRTAGLSDAEREWRAKWLQDQHLHPDEPIHVDAVHRQLNPVRLVYRMPMDKLYQHFLRPTFGTYYGTALRVGVPKFLMALFFVEACYYYWKYEARDWQHLRGIDVLKRQDIWIHHKEIEEAHPGLIDKAAVDPGIYDHYDSKFKKRTSHLDVGETSRPW